MAACKLKLVAIIATARKLVTIPDAMLRDKRAWTMEQAHADPSI